MKNLPSTICRFRLAVLLTFFASSAFAEVPKFIQFKFEVQYNTGKISDNIIADIYGDTLIVGIIPRHQAAFDLKATFATSVAVPVLVDGIGQQSTITVNDFSSPVTYVVTSGTETRTYKVKLVYTGLPLVYIYTNDEAPIDSPDTYINGTIKIYSNDDVVETLDAPLGIKGRGNSTWEMPKKPYRIKLAAAASVLGMPADKDWVLLANYADKSLMRTSLAFDLGYQMNLAWTPKMTHVDLVVNGVYQGNYLIGEHVKVDKDRLNIKELDVDDTDPEKINGGYFLELDNYKDGVYFTLNSGLPIVFKSPDEPTEEQYDFIHNYMQQTEDVIMAPNFDDPEEGYAKYLNKDTFIEYYWVQELFKNVDAQDGSSIYYYKDRDQKLNMGPLWDFDISAGNVDVNGANDPTGFYIRESKWFKRLFQDPVFKNAAEARWFALRDRILANLPDVIDQYAAKLELSQQENFHKWDILNKVVYPSPLNLGSYKNEVDYLKTWLLSRIAWIDANVDPPVLKPMTLISPPDETRIVVLPADQSEEKFSWTPSTSGSGYRVIFDTLTGDFSESIASFDANLLTQDTTATITHAQLYDLFSFVDNKDSVTLQWTIRATLGPSNLDAEEFHTLRIVNGVIGVPQLDSPSADATLENLTPTMKWFKARLATTYDLQLSTGNEFADLAVNRTGLTDTTYVINETLSNQTKYYWRVSAVNGNGPGNWSEVRSFTTPSLPPPVVTGVGERIAKIAIFPNPTSKELYIDLPSDTQIENAEIVDAIGRIAVSAKLSAGESNKLDVSNLQRGIHFLILRGGITKPVTSKIMLR